MRTLLVALLSFLASSVQAEPPIPPVAISVSFDMSDSAHEERVEDVTVAQLQRWALETALRTIAEHDSIGCATALQLQVVYSGFNTREERAGTIALDWIVVEPTKTSWLNAAHAVETLWLSGRSADGHYYTTATLEHQLAQSGSQLRFGLISANGTVAPSVLTQLAAQPRNPSVRLYGASLADPTTDWFMQTVTRERVLITSKQQLLNWYTTLLQTAVAPPVCLVS
jgi:hypothetical protein